MKQNLSKAIFAVVSLCCFLPLASSGLALLTGILISLFVGNPWPLQTKKWPPLLLGACVTAMGASMNLLVVAHTGLEGVGYTVTSIVLTLLLGTLLGRVFNIDREASILISSGTAICGGSAIAAVSTALKSKPENTAVALAIVFALNALALFIFPVLGSHFGMSQHQFGLWSALAIHDTSSVVGASMKYGDEALQVATTVKLTRALWIVPMVVGIQALWHRQSENKVKIKIPWFIYGFILASVVITYVPGIREPGLVLAQVAKKVFVFTLFLIGININPAQFKTMGWRPFAQGALLWLAVGTSTLIYLLRSS